MSPVFHLLTGIVFSKLATNQVLPEIIIASVLPDILGVPLMITDKAMEAIKNPEGNVIRKFKKDLFQETFLKDVDRFAYRITHSLLMTLIFGVFFYWLFPTYHHLLTFNYLLHLLIDVPTHSGDWATRLLYPFSDFHINGYNWWENPKISLAFWSLLPFLYYFAFL